MAVEVDRIDDERQRNMGMSGICLEYLVHFAGQPEDDVSWELADDVSAVAPDLVHDWNSPASPRRAKQAKRNAEEEEPSEPVEESTGSSTEPPTRDEPPPPAVRDEAANTELPPSGTATPARGSISEAPPTTKEAGQVEFGNQLQQILERVESLQAKQGEQARSQETLERKFVDIDTRPPPQDDSVKENLSALMDRVERLQQRAEENEQLRQDVQSKVATLIEQSDDREVAEQARREAEERERAGQPTNEQIMERVSALSSDVQEVKVALRSVQSMLTAFTDDWNKFRMALAPPQ